MVIVQFSQLTLFSTNQHCTHFWFTISPSIEHLIMLLLTLYGELKQIESLLHQLIYSALTHKV